METTKRCLHCNEIKPISEFHKERNRQDGFQYYCKQCYKQYFQAHKAQNRAYVGKYHASLRGYLRHLWRSMLRRCNNPKDQAYKYYGGKGIKVKFASFEDFYDYVVNGLKADPRGLTIDRIDNDGNYEKGNIRFVSQAKRIFEIKQRRKYRKVEKL